MKTRVVRERYAALLTLSRRALPSSTAVFKVAALLDTRFRRAYEASETRRNAIIAEHPTPPGWDGDGLPMSVAEARQRAVDAMFDEDVPIGKVPARLRLTAADLPKVLKRDGGEDNVAGLAEIQLMLGSLYVLGPDELALRAADDETGEEPD